MESIFLLGIVWMVVGRAMGAADLAALYKAVDMDQIEADVRFFSSLGSRVTGYEGAEAAAAEIQNRFKKLGLQDVCVQEFTVPVPIDKGALLKINGTFIRLYALYPNLVRTPSLERGGIRGPLLYVRDGDVARFNGAAVEGAIVLMDFNSGLHWLNAPLLGARAVIFIEPTRTNRGEAQEKFLRVPLSVPRFLMRRTDAHRLLGGALPRAPLLAPEVTLTARVDWENRTAQNIIGFLPGTDPSLSRECLILESYYDSISVVPALAPGAEQACGIATLLELARLLKENPPDRTVAFVATAGHFEALSGARALANTIRREFTREREPKARMLQVRQDQRCLQELRDARQKAEEALAEMREERQSQRPPAADEVAATAKATFALDRRIARQKNYLRELDQQIGRAEADLALTKLFYGEEREDGSTGASEKLSTPRPAPLQGAGILIGALAAWGVAIVSFRRKLLAVGGIFLLVGVAVGGVGGYRMMRPPTEARVHYDKYDLLLFIGLDLSSQNDQVGAFHVGWFYRNDSLTRFFSPVGKRLKEYASEVIAAVPGAGDDTFIDAINPTQDRNWETYVPGQLAVDSEMIVEAGRAGITLATIIDSRPLFDTPLDTIDHVNFPNLEKQVRMLACLISQLINDPELRSTALKRIKRLPFDLKVVNGSVYEFERKKTFLPNTPVPGALVLVKGQYKSMMGVRSDLMTMADSAGDFVMQGYQDYGGAVIDAYGIAPYSGEIVYAPDLGPEGETKYPRDVLGRLGLKRPVIVFPCRSLDVYDLVDERYFETLEQLQVFDARTDSEPRSFGYSLPVFAPMGQTTMGGSVSPSYVEPVAVVFSPAEVKCEWCGSFFPRGATRCVVCRKPRPERPEGLPRVKMTMSMGLLGRRLLLINARESPVECPACGTPYPPKAERCANRACRKRRPGAPGGLGFNPEKQAQVPLTPYRAAKDMWILDGFRMRDYERYGISNQRLTNLHEMAGEELEDAEKFKAAQQYDRFLAKSRSAWAYEARAYPDVMRTAEDVVKGVLFYLALLLPFAYFMERLLIGSVNINKQVGWTFVMFLLVYLILSRVHPAFKLVNTSIIILLGFVIMTLAVVVISIVTTKFNQQLEQLKQEMMGIHTADVGRLSTLGAAFGLGINNMRRRAMRTLLTCTTLVLLTFTVLSFTSVKTFLQSNKIRQKNPPPYPGLLVRDRVWGALEEPTAGIMANSFGRQSIVSPRAWFTSPNLEKRLFIDVTRPGPFPRHYTVNAILGLSPQEKEVTSVESLLVGGRSRWFRPEDQDACLLPQPIARSLGITPEDVGAVQVDIYGTLFTVVGLVDEKKLQALTDLDGETITPVDYSALKPEELKQLQEALQSKLKLGSTSQTSIISEYKHFLPSELIILPYERLINMGGTLRSVAIRFRGEGKTPKEREVQAFEQVKQATRTLMNRFELSAYAGEVTRQGKRETYLYSSVGLTSFSGLENIAIPLIIAALIVLNTMLGAVHERVREIGIFSAIGLAPVHISMLFLAESSVFANIGVILGYLVGQMVSKILFVATSAGYLDSLAGLSLNYSSMSAVGVSIIIIATVLLSTLYPARKAAQMAVPDVERKWRLPDPEGDTMDLRLPFMLTGGDSLACNMFLKEFFDAYVDYAGGDFYTDAVELEGLETEHGLGYLLKLRMWLAPYDLGVSQMFFLRTLPTEEGHVYEIHIILERLSGDINSWKKTNWLFLNLLRKQFLIWRTIHPGQKREYEAQGRQLLQAAA